jgi:mRNA interferase MazF
MNNEFKQGDVWLANVLLRGRDQYKQRPVVLVGNELAVDLDIIMAPVTSQEARGQFDVVLEYWKEAGLVKPSIVRANKITTIHGSGLIYKCVV